MTASRDCDKPAGDSTMGGFGPLLPVMTYWVIGSLWAACGLAAFTTHLVRGRMREARWFGLPVLMLAATLLGPIALVAVIKDDEREN